MCVLVTFVHTDVEDIVFKSIRWNFVLTGVNRDYVNVLLYAFGMDFGSSFCETFDF